MERGSDKHGRRLDDALEHETAGLVSGGHQTRAEEWREAEPSGEDQPQVDLVPDATPPGGTPPGMSAADVAGRSELARYLHRATFPAVRALLLQEAADSQAPAAVLDRLRQLPSGREFANVAEVWAAVGGHNETERT